MSGPDQPRQSPWTQGPVDRVPCPHCNKPLDFRELDGQQLLDTGHEVFCDHCNRSMEVAAIRVVKLIGVRPTTNQRSNSRGRQAALPATTIGLGQLKKLLR